MCSAESKNRQKFGCSIQGELSSLVQNAGAADGICQDIISQLLRTIRAAVMHWKRNADSVGPILLLNQNNQTAGCHQHQAQPPPCGGVLSHQMHDIKISSRLFMYVRAVNSDGELAC